MSRIVITGCREGFRKVSMTKLIRGYTGLGLTPGKHCTDDILEGKTVVFRLPDESAQSFVAEGEALGAICHVEVEEPTLAVRG